MRKEKNFVIFSLVVVGIGVIASVVSVVLLLFAQESLASILGVVSTIVSLVLSVVSIFYTFISGQKTLENLDHIKTQYSALVEKINHELSSDNYDEENIRAVDEMISESAKSVTENKK